ncbi:7 transmembrane receptor [Ditylenchus destructor]|uniref:7 transmembrane receptor n=1 Tax=Ditylenchus destructor TaxID=166010 RepID=A0AAD4QU67_9BILA|nr:7 transmembrane receptor [Ditylenchus destructor]
MQLWTLYFDLLPYFDPGNHTVFKDNVCTYTALLQIRMISIPFYISVVILPLLTTVLANIIIALKIRKRPGLQEKSTPATAKKEANSDDSNRILWILPTIFVLLTTLFSYIMMLEFVFNWFFYALSSSTFRKAFVSFWSRLLCKNRLLASPSQNKNSSLRTDASLRTEETNL